MIEINCPAGPALLLHGVCPTIDGYGARRLSGEVTTPQLSPGSLLGWLEHPPGCLSVSAEYLWGGGKSQWVREQAQEEVSPWRQPPTPSSSPDASCL